CAAGRLSERRPAAHYGLHRHVRARSGGDGARVSGAPRRRLQHRGRVLRVEPRAHPPHRGDRPRPTPEAVSAKLSTAPRVLTALPLAIDPAEVLRFQGYKKSVDAPDPEVRALFDEALALGRSLM